MQVIGLDSSRDQASPLPALSHCCQHDSRRTYPVLDGTSFGLFKMHLVVKSYKYQMQLLSHIQYKVEGFLYKWTLKCKCKQSFGFFPFKRKKE